MISLEMVAVLITLAAVYLTTREVIWCWPLGLISVTLYAVVFYEARLYADMGLQGLYFALSLYGWWAWLHGGKDHGELTVGVASRRLRLLILLAGAAGGLGLGLLLDRFTNADLPFIDSLLTSYSIAAQWMQTRKFLETWLVWLAVDLVYVGMFLYKGLLPTAALYTLFLYLAASGFVRWRHSLHANRPHEAPAS